VLVVPPTNRYVVDLFCGLNEGMFSENIQALSGIEKKQYTYTAHMVMVLKIATALAGS
jgi:hypothetical protein